MKSVLFVCAANVCRSPMAEAIFNALAEDAGSTWRARSAGLAAIEGASPAARAARALAEIGIGTNPFHAARQVNAEMLADADVVLTMTPLQAVELRWCFGQFAEKVHPLPEYAGRGPEASVPDPYGHSEAAFRASARQLLGYLERVVSLVGKEEQTRFDSTIVENRAGQTR